MHFRPSCSVQAQHIVTWMVYLMMHLSCFYVLVIFLSISQKLVALVKVATLSYSLHALILTLRLSHSQSADHTQNSEAHRRVTVTLVDKHTQSQPIILIGALTLGIHSLYTSVPPIFGLNYCIRPFII